MSSAFFCLHENPLTNSEGGLLFAKREISVWRLLEMGQITVIVSVLA
jgi:hypothetical protein